MGLGIRKVNTWTRRGEFMATVGIQILEDRMNRFLGRRELVCLFPLACGLVKREGILRAVADKIDIAPDRVLIFSLQDCAGTRDLRGIIYVYEDVNEANRQLPAHLIQRVKGRIGEKTAGSGETKESKETKGNEAMSGPRRSES